MTKENSSTDSSSIASNILRPHKVNFLFLVVQLTYKWQSHHAFFVFETEVERKWCKNSKMQHRGGNLGPRLQNAGTCASDYKSLDGGATECRLCKYRGCMLNSAYI